MHTHQAISRFRNSRDDYLIEANESLVFYWSSFQSVLIVICGIFQVYFIKRLFNVSRKC
jgi:p24 family protein gamma-5